MKKNSGQYSFAKAAMKKSIQDAIKNGKNPFTGKRYSKAQQKRLGILKRSIK